MDNLSKNLHFVVLGGGILLGIIFVAVGIMVRGGTEQDLEDKQTELQPHVNVYTKGTLDDVEKRAARFDTSVQEAESAITGATGFDADYRDHSTGDAFYTNEANATLRTLRERWTKLAGEDKLPSLIAGWTIKRLGGNDGADGFWDKLAGEVASPAPDRIRELQRQLRTLDELVTTCEYLVADGLDQGMGVKLLDFKAETYQGMTTSKLDSPWNVLQWDLDIECAPGFAVILFDELANPTNLTMKPREGMATRRGFPMLPMILQTEMIERPGELKVDFSNDEKAGLLETLRKAKVEIPNVSEPRDLDPESQDGKKVIEGAVELLEGNEQIVMPVRAGLRMQAAAYNKDWRATNAQDEEE